MHLRRLLASIRSTRIPLFAAALLSATAAGCGGGGGGSSSPVSSPTSVAPSGGSRTVFSSANAWAPPPPNNFSFLSLAYGGNTIGGIDVYTVELFNPTPDAGSTSAAEIVNYSLSIGNTSPVPPAAGSVISYIQFSVSPGAITAAPGTSFELGSEEYVTGTSDPLKVPLGAYVECTVYAGSQLIGSGSNAQIAQEGGGAAPGSLCNRANHGNSLTGAPGFAFSAIEPGTVYTIVYSLLSS